VDRRACPLLRPVRAVQKGLIVALQLVVQDHSRHPAAVRFNPLSFGLIEAVQLRVVTHLSRFHQAGVELLGTVWVRRPMGFQRVLPGTRQRDHGRRLAVDLHRPHLHEALVGERPQVARPGVA
jgi:hypothetical protein